MPLEIGVLLGRLQACLGVEKAVLFTGTTGVGKSVIISGALETLRGSRAVVPYTVNFSAQTQAVDTQVAGRCHQHTHLLRAFVAISFATITKYTKHVPRKHALAEHASAKHALATPGNLG